MNTSNPVFLSLDMKIKLYLCYSCPNIMSILYQIKFPREEFSQARIKLFVLLQYLPSRIDKNIENQEIL